MHAYIPTPAACMAASAARCSLSPPAEDELQLPVSIAGVADNSRGQLSASKDDVAVAVAVTVWLTLTVRAAAIERAGWGC